MKKLLFVSLILGASLNLTGCFMDEGANMANEVAKKTLTGQNAIEQYEFFKRASKSIDAKHQQIVYIQDQIDEIKSKGELDFIDKDDLNALKVDKRALTFDLKELEAEYFARCEMKNRAIFKDNLPNNVFRGINGALQFKYGVKLKALPHSAN